MDLSDADLTNTDLSGSNIQGTNFFGTKLNKTNLSSTKLANLDFSRSFVEGVVLNQVTLENVKGLEVKEQAKAPEIQNTDQTPGTPLLTEKKN